MLDQREHKVQLVLQGQWVFVALRVYLGRQGQLALQVFAVLLAPQAWRAQLDL